MRTHSYLAHKDIAVTTCLGAMAIIFICVATPFAADQPSAQAARADSKPSSMLKKHPGSLHTDVSDVYQRKLVADPYRWLEDTESEATEKWIAAQNELTRSSLDAIPSRPGFAKDRARMVAAVGMMDMLRFHKFTIGWAWVSDFGSSDNQSQLETILRYSRLHNVKPRTCYPATLITTADRDDRVVPGHRLKFAAALQAALSCDQPTLIRIETRAGHGVGTPLSKSIDEYADLWSFLMTSLT